MHICIEIPRRQSIRHVWNEWAQRPWSISDEKSAEEDSQEVVVNKNHKDCSADEQNLGHSSVIGNEKDIPVLADSKMTALKEKLVCCPRK